MEIKGCPFCGGEAEILENSRGCHIRCSECGLDARFLYEEWTYASGAGKRRDDHRAAVANAWNRRAGS